MKKTSQPVRGHSHDNWVPRFLPDDDLVHYVRPYQVFKLLLPPVGGRWYVFVGGGIPHLITADYNRSLRIKSRQPQNHN
jgi:hypothetical protein